MDPGTRVEVRTTFDRSWARGFEVMTACADGYTVRRVSDGNALPTTFPVEAVRRERRETNMWWV